jgi:hypothetical protein
MVESKIKINRAPVLTLWAAVVAERMGYDRSVSLSLGKALAGLNAQTKGKSIGIFSTPERLDASENPKPGRATSEVTLLGRPIPVVETEDGLRASIGGEISEPDSVDRYLKNRFGERLEDVREAMTALAKSYEPETIDADAYRLYEAFRPSIPSGKRGWGAKGELDLDQIRRLAEN